MFLDGDCVFFSDGDHVFFLDIDTYIMEIVVSNQYGSRKRYIPTIKIVIKDAAYIRINQFDGGVTVLYLVLKRFWEKYHEQCLDVPWSYTPSMQ